MTPNHVALAEIRRTFDELSRLWSSAGETRDKGMDDIEQFGEFGYGHELIDGVDKANALIQTSFLRLISRQLLWLQEAMADIPQGAASFDSPHDSKA